MQIIQIHEDHRVRRGIAPCNMEKQMTNRRDTKGGRNAGEQFKYIKISGSTQALSQATFNIQFKSRDTKGGRKAGGQ